MKPVLALLLFLMASYANAQPACHVSSAPHQSIESDKVRQELGPLAAYYDHYPCEKINGKTIYNLIRPLFLYVAGNKNWKRLKTYSVESPMTIYTGPDEDSYLFVSLCKPHACDSDKAGIVLVSEDFGNAGKQLGLAGICFYRRISQSNNRYDFFADGIAVHSKTRVPIQGEEDHIDQCNAKQILGTIYEFYPPQ
jgi:hypothetical protein